MDTLSRRSVLSVGAGTLLASVLNGSIPVAAAGTDRLTIAFNVSLPSFDPTTGGSAVNPTIQAIYRSVFDQFIGQKPNLSFEPGILKSWGWNEDRTKVHLEVRENVLWHDGSPLTPEDVVWSLTRAADPKSGNPVSIYWAKIGNYKINGNTITGDVISYEPAIFKWMAFLTGYVLPKAYYEKVGAQGFEAKPIGTGPYMVDEYQGNAFLRLKANPHYWGGKPPFETVIFKFVTDATSRAAEIESGSSDITLDVSYEEFDRLKRKPGLTGVATPISDVGMIFITNVDPVMNDENVRLAAIYAIDKQAIIKRLLKGYGIALATLEAPEYEAFDPSIKVPHDPKKAADLLKASGYSPAKPVRFKMQTTRGFKPKDYEMIQAIVGMWRKVGIEADIEVYEIAKHYELRSQHKLAPMAFYNWGNAIGDPETSTGAAMFGPSPHSAWKSDKLDAMMIPLFSEKDEAKRIAGWKAVDAVIAKEGLVIPLLQYVQPVLFKSSLKVAGNMSGALQPILVKDA